MHSVSRSILVVSQVFPYPLHDGGRVDIYYRIKALKELGYSIYLVAFYNPVFPPLDLEPLHKICKKIYPLPYLRRKISKILGVKPYSISSRENLSKITDIIQILRLEVAAFRCVISESHHVLTVSQMFKKTLGIEKLYLRSHNNEPKFMLSLAQTSPFFSVKQMFFFIESMRYFFYEKILMRKFSKKDCILHISMDECRTYEKKYPNLRHTFLPAAIDVSEKKAYRETQGRKVLFLGALFSPNNLQGLQWYLKYVHPLVCKKISDYQLIVAGNTQGAPSKDVHRLLSDVSHLKFYDTPLDLGPIYREAEVFINPMQHGAGVKLKTLHAILNGLPVVTTEIGNAGTGLRHDQHLFISSSKSQFQGAVCDLLFHEDKRKKFVLKAQNFLQHHYNQKQALALVL